MDSRLPHHRHPARRPTAATFTTLLVLLSLAAELPGAVPSVRPVSWLEVEQVDPGSTRALGKKLVRAARDLLGVRWATAAMPRPFDPLLAAAVFHESNAAPTGGILPPVSWVTLGLLNLPPPAC